MNLSPREVRAAVSFRSRVVALIDVFFGGADQVESLRFLDEERCAFVVRTDVAAWEDKKLQYLMRISFDLVLRVRVDNSDPVAPVFHVARGES